MHSLNSLPVFSVSIFFNFIKLLQVLLQSAFFIQNYIEIILHVFWQVLRLLTFIFTFLDFNVYSFICILFGFRVWKPLLAFQDMHFLEHVLNLAHFCLQILLDHHKGWVWGNFSLVILRVYFDRLSETHHLRQLVNLALNYPRSWHLQRCFFYHSQFERLDFLLVFWQLHMRQTFLHVFE